MPKFSQASLVQYNTLHPKLQRVLDDAIQHYDFSIIEGFRNKAAQNLAFAKGNSQKQWPNGEHNRLPSTAVDIMPFPVDWSDAAANLQRCCLLAGIMLATGWKLGIPLRWGGDWNSNGDTRDEHFRDYGHFELL